MRLPLGSVCAFIFGASLPLTSSFAVLPWLPVPLLAGSLLLVVLLPRSANGVWSWRDVLLFFFILSPVLFSLIGAVGGRADGKLWSHALSYAVVVFVYYLTTRLALVFERNNFGSGVVVGFCVAATMGVAEFVLVNFYGLEVSTYLAHIAVPEYDPLFYGFVRARSFVEESGHFALYLGIIFPIVLVELRSRNGNVLIAFFWLLFIAAMVVTFSTSGYVFSVVSAALCGILFVGRNSLVARGVIIFGGVGMLVLFAWPSFFEEMFNFIILDKVDAGGGANGRLMPVEDSWVLWKGSSGVEWLFGLGPGYYSWNDVDAVISLHVLTLFQLGVWGLICWIFLWSAMALWAIRSGVPLTFALIYAFLFYFGISNYWYPWLWVLFAYLVSDASRVGRVRMQVRGAS